MSFINFHFNNTSSLAGMAPVPTLGGGFTAAALPAGLAGQGIYIICNHATNNRYAGISGNLANRFGARMAVITECGFPAVDMNRIWLWWGTVSTRNTGVIGPFMPMLNYAAPLNAAIDGVPVNVERLLIRYLVRIIGAGGTVSNNVGAAAPYVNPTANPVTVNFHSAANAQYAAFNDTAIWAVGGAGW
jgi:hypothetical protein